jgi:hypothetical protein
MTEPGQRGGDLETGTAAQSTAVALRLRGDLDGPALEGALRALAARFASCGACPMTTLIGDLDALYRERADGRTGEPATGPGTAGGDSVRLYRWAGGSRRPAQRQFGC